MFVPRVRVAAALLSLALLAAACGGETGRQAGGEPATAAGGGSPRTQDSETRQRPRLDPGAERLARGLLSISDLPAGWSRSEDDARGRPQDTDICTANLAILEQERQKLAEASIGFDRGESGPYLAQSLAAYPPGVAQQVMESLTSAVQSCRTVTVRDDEGSSSIWQLTPLTFPPFGDQALAFREYWPANGVEAIIVYIRRGDFITVLLHIAINSRVDRVQTETFVSRAYERFVRLTTEP